jgi:CheY-like chemotaxis protein
MPASHPIMLVEDHDDTRDAMTMWLESHGYAVVEARDGLQALERLRGGLRPCVIILDLRMPTMSGLELRKLQLEDPALADIPVIVVSGSDRNDEALVHALGAHFVRKPSELPVLLEHIHRHCSGLRSETASRGGASA